MKNFIKEEARDVFNVFKRIKGRDFSGNSGQNIKNSSYQLTQNIILKIGSLIFTVILARMLMPERMGLYNLALATIVMFAAFSDLGISAAVITFCSKALGKGHLGKTKGYAKKLLKWKLNLMIASSLLLVFSAYFIANIYYNKPIFYALLVGGLYLPVVTFTGFLEQLFKSASDFKSPLRREVMFQILRLTIVPLVILLLLKSNFSNSMFIVFVLLTIVICYLLSIFFLFFLLKKLRFLRVPAIDLNKSEEKELRKFIFPLSAMALSGVFFGYIDILMLGHYISSKFIAYYSVAFGLIGSATAILGFSAAASMPIFSKLKGKSLENLFKKSLSLTLSLSLVVGIFTYFASSWIIWIIYGSEYIPSVPILKAFSILIAILPITLLYNSYMISQKKTKIIAILLIGSTALNIILNFIGINYGLRFGELGAVFGAVYATILSRVFYLTGILIWSKYIEK